MPLPELLDISKRHRLALTKVVPQRHAVWRQGYLTGESAIRGIAAVPQLDASERTVVVHALGHVGQQAHIVVIPEGDLLVRERRGVNRAELGTNERPAPFGVDLAHSIQGVGFFISHPGAVRHLVKAVRGGDGSDGERLEQNVVAGITGHRVRPCSDRVDVRILRDFWGDAHAQIGDNARPCAPTRSGVPLMITAVNLNTDLDSLVLLEGRGEHTTEAEAQASFTTVSKFPRRRHLRRPLQRFEWLGDSSQRR